MITNSYTCMVPLKVKTHIYYFYTKYVCATHCQKNTISITFYFVLKMLPNRNVWNITCDIFVEYKKNVFFRKSILDLPICRCGYVCSMHSLPVIKVSWFFLFLLYNCANCFVFTFDTAHLCYWRREINKIWADSELLLKCETHVLFFISILKNISEKLFLHSYDKNYI